MLARAWARRKEEGGMRKEEGGRRKDAGQGDDMRKTKFGKTRNRESTNREHIQRPHTESTSPPGPFTSRSVHMRGSDAASHSSNTNLYARACRTRKKWL
jgi:hypothetical protein